jgi:pilus assembly protein CpaB
MNNRTIVLFVAAVVIAAFTAFVVRNKISTSEPVGNPNVTKVLSATSSIAAGSFVRADKDLAWIDWPTVNLNPSLITQPEHTIESFNGAVARRSILQGEAIVKTAIVKSNEGGFMSAVLTPGLRAVTISVNPTSGNAGFVFPGDKVDLILTHRIQVQDGGSDVLASETFIENSRVLAVDQMLDNPENKAIPARTITLEVTPRQAEEINVATNLGTISVSLRSLGSGMNTSSSPENDKTSGEMSGPHEETYTRDTDVSRLLGSRGSVRARVSVIRGNAMEQKDFHQDPGESQNTGQDN